MKTRRAVFAIPGDLSSVTGGYLYDRSLIAGLRALGRDVHHLELAASFPNPTPSDIEAATRQLAAVPAQCPVIIDGLALGALDQSALLSMSAPIVAMIHHPLALESGLSAARCDHLFRTERGNLALAAQVVVPSPHTASLLTSDFGVAPDRLTIAIPGTLHPSGPPRPVHPPLILSVGIQVPRKGHDVLLRALALIADLPWQATIVGDARDPFCAAELSELVKALKLDARVRFAGKIPDDELGCLYKHASIFALATRHEGYGIVFAEAMAHGVPIVSSKVGAVPDTVADDAALLVPPDDPIAFAKALSRLLDDNILRRTMATAAAAAGRALPGWEDACHKVEAALVRASTQSPGGD